MWKWEESSDVNIYKWVWENIHKNDVSWDSESENRVDKVGWTREPDPPTQLNLAGPNQNKHEPFD